MSYLFGPENESMRHMIKRFVRSEINAQVDAREEAGVAPLPEIFKVVGELGLLGINKPTELGGLGLVFSYVMVAVEALGEAHCASIPFAIGAHLSAIPAIT